MGSGLDDGRGIREAYVSSKYATFDFNASYDATDWATIYFKALNFTNQSYRYSSDPCYPSAGKFFSIGVDCKF